METWGNNHYTTPAYTPIFEKNAEKDTKSYAYKTGSYESIFVGLLKKVEHLHDTNISIMIKCRVFFPFLIMPRPSITVETQVNLPAEKTWKYWTQPEHIMQWNTPSPDWYTPRATSDLKKGGEFLSRMEAKDGSAGFDFKGIFTTVIPKKTLAYEMSDGRKVLVTFEEHDGGTFVSETFDPENENPLEMQRDGWQAILNNFKKYAEAQG